MRSPWGVSSMAGPLDNRVTSTSDDGVITPSFIRSTTFVPPPRNSAPGTVPEVIAAVTSGGRV